jgi:hypothetical protein
VNGAAAAAAAGADSGPGVCVLAVTVDDLKVIETLCRVATGQGEGTVVI